MKSIISLPITVLALILSPLAISGCTRSSAQAVPPPAPKGPVISEIVFVNKVQLETLVLTGPLGGYNQPFDILNMVKDGEIVIIKTAKDEIHVPLSNVAWYKVAKASADK